MLIQSHSGANGYYGFGAGLGALTQSKDFNCNSSICYAIGKENDALFKLLQQRINALSGIGGFQPLVVDGFIGAATVGALQALGKVGLTSPPATKEQAAARASELITALTSLATVKVASGQALSPTGTPVTYQPPPPSVAIQPTQIPGASPAAAALPKVKSKALWWILGGIVGVATVGGVGYVVYRRKARGY